MYTIAKDHNTKERQKLKSKARWKSFLEMLRFKIFGKTEEGSEVKRENVETVHRSAGHYRYSW